MNIAIVLDDTLLNLSSEYFIEKITSLDKSNYITGVEFSFTKYNENIKKYLIKFASLCKNYNLTINFRGIYLDLDIQIHIQYLKLYDSIAKLLGQQINVTYSSCLNDTLKLSIDDTISKYITIISYIKENNYNLNICIENLEYLNKPSVKDIITTILPNVYGLKLSYNIGHESLIGYSKYDLPSNATKEDYESIENIYIHDNDTKYAHLGFNYGNIDLYEVKDFIKSNNYNKQITIDIDLIKVKGDTLEEKIYNYICEVNKVGFMIK